MLVALHLKMKKRRSNCSYYNYRKRDIEVPANPKRVVANWYVGEVITLGLNLVGYNAWEQETMPFYDKLKATKK
ncbi:hypothetical protein JTS99_08810 [Clostridium botulinum]|nr:hypothetical protein [Clostridium botulinum]